VALGLVVGLGRRRTDDVEPELPAQPLQLSRSHTPNCASVCGRDTIADR
jgi:hypothetical protein